MHLLRIKWIRMLAVLSVVLHGYVLTVHNGAMISMALASESAGPLIGIGVICRANGQSIVVDFDDLAKGGTGKPIQLMKCPVCSGAVPSAALSPPVAFALVVPISVPMATPHAINAALPVARAPKPPSTGPPIG